MTIQNGVVIHIFGVLDSGFLLLAVRSRGVHLRLIVVPLQGWVLAARIEFPGAGFLLQMWEGLSGFDSHRAFSNN
jgi:hypothetical protein